MNLGEPKKAGVTIPATRPIEQPAPTPPAPAKTPAKVDA